MFNFQFSVTFHQGNFNSKLSTGSLRPGLVRIPDPSRSWDCSPPLFRRSPPGQVRGILLDRDEASGETSQDGVHEGARLPQLGWWGSPLHGPCCLCSQRRYILSQTKLSLAGLMRDVYKLSFVLKNCLKISESSTFCWNDFKWLKQVSKHLPRFLKAFNYLRFVMKSWNSLLECVCKKVSVFA